MMTKKEKSTIFSLVLLFLNACVADPLSYLTMKQEAGLHTQLSENQRQTQGDEQHIKRLERRLAVLEKLYEIPHPNPGPLVSHD